MAGQRKLHKAYKRLDKKKANEIVTIPGILGFPINGVNTVEVRNRNGYVYVRLRDNQSEVVQAFNTNVSPVYGLPVLITRDKINKSRYSVLSRDIGRYENWGTSSPYLPRHGAQHSFDPTAVGGDIVWVYNRQFMPLNVYPSGSFGSMNVLISPTTYYRNGLWHYAGETGTASFAGYKPTGSSARMVLVSLDSYDNPQLTPGSFFLSSLTGTNQIFSYIPQVPATDNIPIAAIRLVSGTSVINWDNIYDVRPFFMASGFQSTGSSGHIIADEGTPLATRPTLNFIGTNVWAQDNAGNNRTDIIISGTSGGPGGGSLPDTEIGFGNGTAIVSSPYFTYDSSYRYLTMGATYDESYGALFEIHGDDEVLTNATFSIYRYAGSGFIYPPKIHTWMGRGTKALPAPVLSGDSIFELASYGWATGSSGNDYWNGFSLQAIATSDWLGDLSPRFPTYLLIKLGSTEWADTQNVARFDGGEVNFAANFNVSGTSSSKDLRLRPYSFSGSNPPTDAQLDAGIGDSSAKGKGFMALFNNVGTGMFLVVSDGVSWWHHSMTKAA